MSGNTHAVSMHACSILLSLNGGWRWEVGGED